MRSSWEQIRDQRGATALFMALAISMFFGAGAMAVDLGMLATARAEAQNAADGAALAAAAAYAYGRNVEDDARALAAEFAARNSVRNQSVQLQAGDITLSGDTVRIRVVRSAARGNAIPTMFARVLGTNSIDISATAAAAPIAGPAAIPCLLPIAVPDRWVNRRKRRWNPREGDYYPSMFRRDGTYNPLYVGYTQTGERLEIRPQPRRKKFRRGANKMEPSRSFLWLPGRARGSRAVRARARGCPDGADVGYESGDWLKWYDADQREVGDALRAAVQDPRYSGQYYNARCQCIRDRNNHNALVTGGPRYRALPVFDPSTFQWWSNRQNFEVTHFVGVFVERVRGKRKEPRIQVRVLPLVGTGIASAHAGPLVKVLRLVE